ncbi:hypothetical protein [Acinetobacter nosocomialis]|uniref:hypothetical protein n=1 Tax=Acinetobacter nosocomialis TaxID=106654 RepID=UPI0034CF4E36
MDKCREEFEQYIRDQSGFTADFQVGPNGQYKSDLMHFMFATFQHQQAKVEELQTQLSLQRQRVKAFEEELTNSRNYGDELQKRVDAALAKLDQRRNELWSKWKDRADMQDQGAANAFEEAYWILEQALKGEGQ